MIFIYSSHCSVSVSGCLFSHSWIYICIHLCKAFIKGFNLKSQKQLVLKKNSTTNCLKKFLLTNHFTQNHIFNSILKRSNFFTIVIKYTVNWICPSQQGQNLSLLSIFCCHPHPHPHSFGAKVILLTTPQPPWRKGVHIQYFFP